MEEKQWYVVNTYSGHENKVKEKLDMRIQSMNMQDYIFRVIVPEVTETEIKDGKKKEKVKKLFPGYVLVEMIMTDEAWYVIRNTPGVTGFLGSSGKGAKPFPLMKSDIDNIFKIMGISDKKVTVDLNEGDRVKITDGPFKLMVGKVLEIDKDNSIAKVSIDLFGQETTVEVNLTDVEIDK
jgi:transcriptional antiterminator NusG